MSRAMVGRRAVDSGAGGRRRPAHSRLTFRSRAIGRRRSTATSRGSADFRRETLKGWEGNPTYWRVEGGALVGEITPATVVKSNTFIIWRGGRPEGLRAEARLPDHAGGNSGINYRSASVPDPVTTGERLRAARLPVRHRRAEALHRQNYEEKGRLFMAMRGQVTRVVGGRPPVVVASIGDEAELAAVATDDWNAVHLIVRGNTPRTSSTDG